ncbi:MAG: coenzyme F420-0:L-glutamate ligase [Firmicutes bacterium]|nr:coenzyme F420-0:L-glutamate ligase [Bacillota bacterium]
MERYLGTVVRGLRTPVIRQGDDLAGIVVDTLLKATVTEGFALHDRDVLAVTEAVLARAQGNYATTAQIAADVRAKLGNETIGVVFPILSRNRFAICLRGIAAGAKKIVLLLQYPADEVGNHLISWEELDKTGLNPRQDILTLQNYRELFGAPRHLFTGLDYVAYYEELIHEAGAEAEIIFGNDPRAVLAYCDNVLCCDIHSRERSRRLLKEAGAKNLYLLSQILSTSIDGSGFNSEYGLLGSNKATEDTVKLFPRDSKEFVEKVALSIKERSGRSIEVMVYGDGAFKDPIGHIWELADPVVSPAYTDGLKGTPHEVKLKYLADNNFAHLSGEELKEAIRFYIRDKSQDFGKDMDSQGTTPRRITDLLGSLCDLTSGSGDKGTPIVLVQGYFDNYADF